MTTVDQIQRPFTDKGRKLQQALNTSLNPYRADSDGNNPDVAIDQLVEAELVLKNPQYQVEADKLAEKLLKQEAIRDALATLHIEPENGFAKAIRHLNLCVPDSPGASSMWEREQLRHDLRPTLAKELISRFGHKIGFNLADKLKDKYAAQKAAAA